MVKSYRLGQLVYRLYWYTVADGLPIPSTPEPAAVVFIITFATMVIAGVWLKLTK